MHVRDDNKGNGHLKTKKFKYKKLDLKLVTGWIQIRSILFQWFLDLRPYRKDPLCFLHSNTVTMEKNVKVCTLHIYAQT